MAPQLLPQRRIGSQGFVGSMQGLGCMGMSSAYHAVDFTRTDEESLAVVARAKELGVTLLDTSDVYGPWTNELLLSKALAGHRDEYQLCTKFGSASLDGGRMPHACGTPEHVRAACLGSLKRLGIDCIDLYYQHRIDHTTPIEETWGELKKLVEERKVKYLGISEATPDEIRRAHAVHPISAVQLEWSLWTRDAETTIIPVCRELGIGIVAYSPLGRGFLTGKLKSMDALAENDSRRNGNPRFAPGAFEKNVALLEKVEALATKKGCTPGQLALAWVHNQGEDVFPIPGTKRIKYLEENAAAAFIKLSPEEMKDLEAAIPPSEVVGTRYNAEGMKRAYHGRYAKAAAEE